MTFQVLLDDITIFGLWAQVTGCAARVQCVAVLFAAGNIGHRLHNAQALYKLCGFNILLVEYRGYGKSEGTPSERGEGRGTLRE